MAQARILLTVDLPDGSTKKLQVPAPMKIAAVKDMLASKLELREHQLFSLAEASDAGDRWLSMDRTLSEENVKEQSRLVFKAKFVKSPLQLTDRLALGMLYDDTKQRIFSLTVPLSVNDAVQMAALQVQIAFGDHDSQKHKPGFLTLASFMPFSFNVDSSVLQARIFRVHALHRGMQAEAAKLLYIQLARKRPMFGVDLFPAQVDGKAKIIGIAEQGVYIFNETIQCQGEFPFETIAHCTITSGGDVAIARNADSDPILRFNVRAARSAVRFEELFCGYRMLAGLSQDAALAARYDIPVGIQFEAAKPRLFPGAIQSRLHGFQQQYTDFCRSQGLVPLQNLLRIVEVALDSGVLLSDLDLSGSQMDDKHAQAVFSALMKALAFTPDESVAFDDNLVLNSLNLSNNSISLAGVTHLLPILRTSPSLVSVNLTKNKLDNKAAMALAPGLSVCALTTLDLSTNAIGNKGLVAILEACKVSFVLQNAVALT
eukprot:TRINITY_DN2716_c0_g1_i3.p1 TRINITY_DN2716_c0_g1~~TRINITY_DN2716_c0_g1_i3.p1  ORF type:complete len:497 (-),score=72.45 TRINITY_DN2716_c0_g1_i3:1448-2908(-)